jgi:hypothetical protein
MLSSILALRSIAPATAATAANIRLDLRPAPPQRLLRDCQRRAPLVETTTQSTAVALGTSQLFVESSARIQRLVPLGSEIAAKSQMPSARPARAGRPRTQRCATSARIGCACPLHRASPSADALKREASKRSRISGSASCRRRISMRRGRIHELEPRQESSYAGPTGRCHTWRAEAAVGTDAGRAGRAEDEAEEPISSMATAELAGSVRAVQVC